MTGEHGIDDRVQGWIVRHVAETGSTNADLLADVEAGRAGDRTALRTDHQVAGRGRLSRSWEAPPGTNLLVSLLFTEVPDAPHRLVQRVGLAALDAIDRLVGSSGTGAGPGRGVGLKWPNDLLVVRASGDEGTDGSGAPDERKLAGILAQRSASTGAVVVGMGLNVGWAPEGAASLSGDLGLDVPPHDLLLAVLRSLEADRSRLDDPAVLTDAYRRRLRTLGRDVRVELPGDRELRGRAVDVDVDGRLVVEPEDAGAAVRLDVGDVVHVRAIGHTR